MANVVILSWNIKDLNESRINDPKFIELVVKVIQQQKANLVSILETKSDKGKDLGNKLKGKLGVKWEADASGKSAPHSNKPENYVFAWDTAIVTRVGTFKFPDGQAPPIGFPNMHKNLANKNPSRFPCVAKFKAGTTTFTCVSFHTTFASVDIAEANQNLAKITEVMSDNDVIVMGDFNDDPANSRSYKGVRSFDPLVNLKFQTWINTKTSLCQAYIPSWKTTMDCRASVYDNFFVKTSGNLTVAKAEVVDLVDALRHPSWLNEHGKNLFNSWAKRENAAKAKKKKAWVMIPLFQATETIATLEDAHEVHWVAVSDHLPIRMEVTLS